MNFDRRQQIIDLISQKRTVKNGELMERFDISIETVRRDLEYLEKQGYLRRVYGGAVLNTTLGREPEYDSRSKEHFEEKCAIAAAAVKLIGPEESVFLGVGTTVQAMAKYMKNLSGVTVFTNALRTAIVLSETTECAVILPGGELRRKELTLSGFPAEDNFAHFNVNKAFIGIGGITGAGITDFHVGEAQLHRRMINNARQSIVLADSSKLGIRAMTNVCTLQEVDIVITDNRASMTIIKELEQTGVEVIIAED